MTTSRKAINERRVQQAGSLGQSKGDYDMNDELEGVKQVISEFIQRVHNNIEEQGLNVSGSINNISIEQTDKGVAVTAPSHLEYIDKGVSGNVTKYDTPYSYTNKMPPPKEFEDWIIARQINTRNNEQYSGQAQDFEGSDEKRIKSMAFAMAKNKQKHGQAPTHVYSSEVPKLVEDVKQYLKDFTINSIAEAFKNDNNT